MKITGNPRAVQILILLAVAATLALAYCSKSEAEEPTFFAGIGPNFTSTSLRTGDGLRVGLEAGPWQASIVTHGEAVIEFPEARYYVQPNMGACGTWHRGFRRLSVGWGACLWEHGDFDVGDAYDVNSTLFWEDDLGAYRMEDDGIQLTAAIVMRRVLGAREHYYVEWFHASTAGATHYNRGRNLFTVGARF
jgi:hypothetical protein